MRLKRRLFVPRFRVSTILWAMLLAAVLISWYRDRVALLGVIQQLRGSTGTGWSVQQVLGPPDTFPRSGDIATAWASKTPDGQREWLLLDYPRAVDIQRIEIYETYNPGAVDRVTGFDLLGREVTLWEGTDPTPPGQPCGVSVIVPQQRFKTRRIKIYIDSPSVSGWNEIDAVGLVDWNGQTSWASHAWASSAYSGDPQPDRWASWIAPRSAERQRFGRLPSSGGEGGMETAENWANWDKLPFGN